jgi:hypothetical protein
MLHQSWAAGAQSRATTVQSEVYGSGQFVRIPVLRRMLMRGMKAAKRP